MGTLTSFGGMLPQSNVMSQVPWTKSAKHQIWIIISCRYLPLSLFNDKVFFLFNQTIGEPRRVISAHGLPYRPAIEPEWYRGFRPRRLTQALSQGGWHDAPHSGAGAQK
jgi:hypothetical protein